MSAVLPLPALALADGQPMSREDFHAAYLAAPAGVRAELVQGIVRMASPVSAQHGFPLSEAVYWLVGYKRATPGTVVADNATLRLGDDELQPDAMLLRTPAAGGRCQVGEDGYFVGPPELVLEIAVASERLDLGDKRAAYAQAGVQEYLVILPQRSEVRRFRQDNGDLRTWPADADGLLRSAVFPGLWLDPAALLIGATDAVAETLRRGLASPEHAAFVAQLQERLR